MATKSTVFSFNQFVRHLAEYGAAKADMRDMLRVLKANAPKLTKPQKIEADHAIVAALSKRYDVKATVAEKNGRLSMLTFRRDGHEDDATRALYARASSALASCRALLDPKPVQVKSIVERAKEAIYRALRGDDDDLQGEARAAVKALFLSIQKNK